MSLFQRWSDALATLKAQGRYRSFSLPKGIDLTSNDYLGYGNGRCVQDLTPQPPLRSGEGGKKTPPRFGEGQGWGFPEPACLRAYCEDIMPFGSRSRKP